MRRLALTASVCFGVAACAAFGTSGSDSDPTPPDDSVDAGSKVQDGAAVVEPKDSAPPSFLDAPVGSPDGECATFVDGPHDFATADDVTRTGALFRIAVGPNKGSIFRDWQLATPIKRSRVLVDVAISLNKNWPATGAYFDFVHMYLGDRFQMSFLSSPAIESELRRDGVDINLWYQPGDNHFDKNYALTPGNLVQDSSTHTFVLDHNWETGLLKTFVDGIPLSEPINAKPTPADQLRSKFALRIGGERFIAQEPNLTYLVSKVCVLLE